jgi:DNA processing protein
MSVLDQLDHPGARLGDDERLDRLRLIRSDNVGPRTFRLLLRHYGSTARALAALPDLARRGGASRPPRVCARAEAERELTAAALIGVRLVALGEPDYPRRLRMIDDAPPLLAVRGEAAALEPPMVAIVGARNASAAGMRFAERLARELGSAGFAIVSGAASTPPPTARALPPAPSRCWPAATSASIRPSMSSWPRPSPSTARSFRRCRSPGSRAPATSPAATG